MLTCLVVALLGSSLSAFAAPVVEVEELSNAERIQRGLPLKAPKRHFDPSRVRARDSTTSAGVTNPQVISVGTPGGSGRRGTGNPQYLWLDSDASPPVVRYGTLDQAMVIDLPTTQQTDGPLKIIGSGQYLASMVDTDYEGIFSFTTANAVTDGGTMGVQTNVWNYNPTTQSLSTDRMEGGETKPLILGYNNDNTLLATYASNGSPLTHSLSISTTSVAAAKAAQGAPPTMSGTATTLMYGSSYIVFKGDGFYAVADQTRATTFYRTVNSNTGIYYYQFIWNNQAQAVATQYAPSQYGDKYNLIAYPFQSITGTNPALNYVWTTNQITNPISSVPATSLIGQFTYSGTTTTICMRSGGGPLSAVYAVPINDHVMNNPYDQTPNCVSFVDTTLPTSTAPIVIDGVATKLTLGTGKYFYYQDGSFYITLDSTKATPFYRTSMVGRSGETFYAYSFALKNQKQTLATQKYFNGYYFQYSPIASPLNTGITGMNIGPVETNLFIVNQGKDNGGIDNFPLGGGSLVGKYDDNAANPGQYIFFCFTSTGNEGDRISGGPIFVFQYNHMTDGTAGCGRLNDASLI